MSDERNRGFDDRGAYDRDHRNSPRGGWDDPRPYDGGRDREGRRYEREDRNFRGGGTGYGGTYGRERDDRAFGRVDHDRARGSFPSERSSRVAHDDHRGSAYHEERGFLDRAGDEVRSWFGDEEAERRREMDERDEARWDANHVSRAASRNDADYRSWRQMQIDALDRDYDEYRRENAARFEREFAAWRAERQAQRDALTRVTEGMEVVGFDGAPVGTVDAVRGDRIILAPSEADPAQHAIPSRWIDSVADKVTLRKSAADAQRAWHDEAQARPLIASGSSGGRLERG